MEPNEFVMKTSRVLITTLTFMILIVPRVLAQTTYVSGSNILYQYDPNLQRVEIDSYEEETVLTVDALNKQVILKSATSVQSFNILTAEEFQMEAGMMYKYDIKGEDGVVRRLEINTQKRNFIMKPKEIQAGETTRKYLFN